MLSIRTGRALYDAAAVLKYSITRNTYPAGSKYNATMYAFVHPNAIVCKTPNDEEYDRVRVLQVSGSSKLLRIHTTSALSLRMPQ